MGEPGSENQPSQPVREQLKCHRRGSGNEIQTIAEAIGDKTHPVLSARNVHRSEQERHHERQASDRECYASAIRGARQQHPQYRAEDHAHRQSHSNARASGQEQRNPARREARRHGVTRSPAVRDVA